MPTQMGCEAYRGNFPKRDNAAVWALRQAGAVVLGKTVTAELGGSHPGPTTNPFDPARTPGGSSSGSAAAVAARMVPAAIGTQVGGSIIRPAAYCGNVALKPTQGGINRGERQATSMSTHGVHAGSIEDMWQVAIEIASRCGGDRGWPRPHRPAGAARGGKARAADRARDRRLGRARRARAARHSRRCWRTCAALGVTLARRGDHPWVEALEQAVGNARALCNAITTWENRWYQRNLSTSIPTASARAPRPRWLKAEAMTPDDYRARPGRTRKRRSCATPPWRRWPTRSSRSSCPGPAPLWSGDVPGQPLAPRPTGDFVFNAPSSMLFAPAVTVPLMAVGGMPVGVQVMGQRRRTRGSPRSRGGCWRTCRRWWCASDPRSPR